MAISNKTTALIVQEIDAWCRRNDIEAGRIKDLITHLRSVPGNESFSISMNKIAKEIDYIK